MDTTVEVFALKDALWKLTTRVAVIENFISNKFGASAISVLQQQLSGVVSCKKDDSDQLTAQSQKQEVSSSKRKPMPASMRSLADKRKSESSTSSHARKKTTRLSEPITVIEDYSDDEGSSSDAQNSTSTNQKQVSAKKETMSVQIKPSSSSKRKSTLSSNQSTSKRTRGSRSVNYNEDESSDDGTLSDDIKSTSTSNFATTIKIEEFSATANNEIEDYDQDNYVEFSPLPNDDADDHITSKTADSSGKPYKKVKNDKKLPPLPPVSILDSDADDNPVFGLPLPMNFVEEVHVLNTTITESQSEFNHLVAVLKFQGGSTVREAMDIIMKELMTDDLACGISYHGARGKQPFIAFKTIINAIINTNDQDPLGDNGEVKILSCKSTDDDGNMVCLGEGTFVNASEVNTVKALSHTPTVLARNLMRVLFTEDELRGKSLFGRKCNANLDAEPLPEIDPRRRDAIIMYSAVQFGHKITDVHKRKLPILRDLKRSMGDYLRELTTKRGQQ